MTVKTRVQINSDADTLLPDNTSAEISPADLRGRIKDLADSALMAEDVGTTAGKLVALDGSGKIDAAVLPSYVDDVLEFANLAALPGTGETGKIYITLDTNYEYRWSGSAYIRLVASPGSTDAVPEGATNLYFTAARVLATALTGLSLLTSTAVVATDTVLQAIGKLQKQLSDLSAIPRREVLTAARTYYVRVDGSDSNNGLADTAGGAFLTIQKAINVAASLDISIYDVTIQIGAGTYDLGNAGLVAKSAVGAGSIIIVGNEASPATVILRTTGVTVGTNIACLSSQNLSTTYKIRGVHIESTTGTVQWGLRSVGSSRLEFQNVDFGAGLSQQVRAEDGGILAATGPYTISGNPLAGGFHIEAVGGGVVRVQSQTITFVNTLAFGFLPTRRRVASFSQMGIRSPELRALLLVNAIALIVTP
ncbi:hypothetical protein ACVDG5_018310 [Mesorhizobium sp. ORM6]